MPNYWGRMGAPMIQPTKDDIRRWLSEARTELKQERLQRQIAEYRLGVATRKLGELVLEGKIAVPVQTLGEMVLQIAIEDDADRSEAKATALIEA